MADILDVTASYVRFKGGAWSTENRYLRDQASASPVIFAASPTWNCTFLDVFRLVESLSNQHAQQGTIIGPTVATVTKSVDAG